MPTPRHDEPAACELIPVGSPGAGPYALTTGPDGALWVTLVHSGQIAQVHLDGDVVLHDLGAPDCRPSQIAVGVDGALWFTRMGDDRIGRITTDGQASSIPVTTGSSPYGITSGPDGALWYTALSGDRIGRLTVDGQLTETPVPLAGGMPSVITVGPASNVKPASR